MRVIELVVGNIGDGQRGYAAPHIIFLVALLFYYAPLIGHIETINDHRDHFARRLYQSLQNSFPRQACCYFATLIASNSINHAAYFKFIARALACNKSILVVGAFLTCIGYTEILISHWFYVIFLFRRSELSAMRYKLPADRRIIFAT